MSSQSPAQDASRTHSLAQSLALVRAGTRASGVMEAALEVEILWKLTCEQASATVNSENHMFHVVAHDMCIKNANSCDRKY